MTAELATSSKYLTPQVVNDTENTCSRTSSSKNRVSRSHRKHKRQLTPDLLRKDHKSDSEEEGIKKKYVTKKAKEKSGRSGYSSSEENTDTENESKFRNSESALRKRNVLKVLEESKEINKEIFLQEVENKASDITDGETSDDFWKSQEQKQDSKLKKRKTLKIKKSYKWKKSISELIAEWNYFKEEEHEQVRKIRVLKNQCMIELLIVFIYLGIGGMIFRITEGSFEMLYKCGVKRVKRDFLDNLWEKSRYLREDEWKSEARIKLMEFENQLYDAYEAGLSSYSGQKGWSFINSIVYCITVITTIGYGHMSPDTNPGKFITIIYSLFGIPMFLILLADYGKLFTRGIKYIWAFVRRLYYTGSCRNVRRTAPVQEMMKGMQMVYDMTKLRRPSTMVDENCAVELNKENETQASPTATPALSAYTIDDEFNLPISVAFTILVVYMVGGALFFSHTEDWEFFKAFYFVYISISTIGFGDIVPRSQWFLMLVSLVYFVFGLALTSMCINVVQEKLSDSIRQASAKLGARIGFEETEEENDANKLQVPVAE